jgi:hypothetical protein
MRIARYWLLPITLLFTGCSMFSGPERSSWFPLRVGNEWEYHLVSTMEQDGRTDTTTTAVYRHRIAGTRKLENGSPVFTRVWDSNVTLRDSGLADSSFSQSETTYLRRTKRWVYRYLTPSAPPDSILGLPPELDQKWQSAGIFYWIAAREDISIGGRQCPRCWRLKMTEVNSPNSSVAWFARGFGLVRLATERTFGTKKLRTDYFLTQARIR